MTLRTPRLLLRPWTAADREPFARLNADARVMEHFPSTLTREESDALADRIERHFAEHGWGPWAVEIPDVAPFAGYIGLAVPNFDAHFTPCIEIGWRLAANVWNRGYATEGARAALTHAFDVLNLQEVVAFTVPANIASRRVMERIGMVHHPGDDFDHPSLPPGHPLKRHVLYRLTVSECRRALPGQDDG